MAAETYKGRKITVRPFGNRFEGRGFDVTVNGQPSGLRYRTDDEALTQAKRWIDHVDSEPVNGDRWPAYWYAPGTYTLCEDGHPVALDGECVHAYCARRRVESAGR